MEILIYIVIGLFFIWLIYDFLIKENKKQNSKEKILRRFDNGDKCYYFKLKIKFFIAFLIGALVFIIAWLIFNIF